MTFVPKFQHFPLSLWSIIGNINVWIESHRTLSLSIQVFSYLVKSPGYRCWRHFAPWPACFSSQVLLGRKNLNAARSLWQAWRNNSWIILSYLKDKIDFSGILKKNLCLQHLLFFWPTEQQYKHVLVTGMKYNVHSCWLNVEQRRLQMWLKMSAYSWEDVQFSTVLPGWPCECFCLTRMRALSQSLAQSVICRKNWISDRVLNQCASVKSRTRNVSGFWKQLQHFAPCLRCLRTELKLNFRVRSVIWMDLNHFS